ncbi:MAG TPA: amidohydrolase family protein [Silvibacterium sp.]|jgi:L-fuconolactonase|nr:amidohydrolase family protein [Silvibacterium sp.]
MPQRIDAHHHLWRYTAEEYSWIDNAMMNLRRDYTPADLSKAMESAGIDGSIAVQARQTLEETHDLLLLADAHPFIKAVVGWAPIASRDFPSFLENLAAHPKLRGLRHVVQSEPDDDFILGSDFNRGIRTLLPTGLIYEILIYERHLPQTIQFVDAHPNQIFVLDHIAKPRIREQILSPWRERIEDLARRENVFCKVSGMVTEADWQLWTEADLRPYLDTVFDAFGAHRLMMGSDWPVCLVATEYARWFDFLDSYVAALSEDERGQFCGGTASRVYRLTEMAKSPQIGGVSTKSRNADACKK